MNILKSLMMGCLLAFSFLKLAVAAPITLGVCVEGDKSYNGAVQNNFIVQLEDTSGQKSSPVTLPSANDTDYAEFTTTAPKTIGLTRPGHDHHAFICNPVALKSTTQSVQVIVNYGDNGQPATCLIRISDYYQSQEDCLNT